MAEQPLGSRQDARRTPSKRPAPQPASRRVALPPAANDNLPPLSVLIARALIAAGALAVLAWAGWQVFV